MILVLESTHPSVIDLRVLLGAVTTIAMVILVIDLRVLLGAAVATVAMVTLRSTTAYRDGRAAVAQLLRPAAPSAHHDSTHRDADGD